MKKQTHSMFVLLGFLSLVMLIAGCTSGSLSFGTGGPQLYLEYDSSASKQKAIQEETEYEQDAWAMTAEMVGNEIGRQYSLYLPPGGEAGSVWGSGIYTDDSLVGSAAVHSNLISFETGGEVHFVITEGRKLYAGTTRNGVSSASYGPWPKSFMFVNAKGSLIEPQALQSMPIEWHMNGHFLHLEEGEEIVVSLPPGGEEDTLWGNNPYTVDSSIGSAAVHAGLITFARGGTITVKAIGEKQYFKDSLRNGVQSMEYDLPMAAFTVAK